MTNLNSVLESRDITLLTKIYIVESMVSLVVITDGQSWTTKKAECQIIDSFESWGWRRLVRVLKEIKPVILREINPEY